MHIYIDLQMSNTDTNPTSRPPQINFEVTKDKPFLEGNAGNYFVTVTRFNIQTGSSLPVMIPDIEPNQPNISQTVYKMSIVNRVTHTPYTLSITYFPSNFNTAIPSSPVTTQDYTSRYYYIMNYQDFIGMMNNTLTLLWAMAGPTGPISKAVPFVEWDAQNNICIINLEQTSFTNTYTLYFNTRLMQLFTSLPSYFMQYDGDLNYIINNDGSNHNTRTINVNYQGTNTPYTFIQVFQEISSIGLLNPVRSIVFTTNTLPIYPTQTSPPKLYNSQSTGMVGSGSPNISNILSDFEIPINSTNQYRPEINYTPPGEYRLIDLFNNENLSKIDLNVWWKDKYGNMNAFLLQPGCTADVKLMFRQSVLFRF